MKDLQVHTLSNGQLVHELKQYFTSDELNETADEIDRMVAESKTLEDLVNRIRQRLVVQA